MAENNTLDRRNFMKMTGGVIGAVAAASLTGCGSKSETTTQVAPLEPGSNNMTYRVSSSGDRVSLLGYGCMRLPTLSNKSARDSQDEGDEIDQERVNALIDEAMEHGVNFFDTSPAYCKGKSEHSVGIALKRHKRDTYFISTKLSNFAESAWPREESIKMYENSRKELLVDDDDHIDYMLLHGIGMGGMEAFNHRYIENGIMDFLFEERAKGRIRNLGFSYHGDIEVFDHLLSMHDEKHWDFALIQLNYVDWKHAKEVNSRNTNAEYLYNELHKRGIPALVMEPLLGGRLASLNFKSIEQLKRLDPEASIASWAFRYAGNPEGVLTVLSGMTYREHLRENLRTYSPLKPLSQAELDALEETALTILQFPLIPCNTCQYCMPCPYGLDIPTIFTHYNKCLNEGNYSKNIHDENYKKARQAFLVGYDRSVPKLRQAKHCIGCNACMPHCPQRIDISAEMKKIDLFVEYLKQNKPE